MSGPPESQEAIHDAYQRQKEIIVKTAGPIERLALEDAYLHLLHNWSPDEPFEPEAVLTNKIFDAVKEAHQDGEIFTDEEVQSIAAEIMIVLHNPWTRISIPAWNKIIQIRENDDLPTTHFNSILREALLRYFGYYGSHQGQRNRATGPRIMSPAVADHIFTKMGWNIPSGRSEKEKQELEWLRKELGVDLSRSKRITLGLRDIALVIGTLILVLSIFFYVWSYFQDLLSLK